MKEVNQTSEVISGNNGQDNGQEGQEERYYLVKRPGAKYATALTIEDLKTECKTASFSDSQLIGVFEKSADFHIHLDITIEENQ